MDPNQQDYHISFFKPTSKSARLNRNMTILLLCIWFVAVFGFQLALRILEKPVPEPTYNEWQDVWPGIRDGNPADHDLQVFAQTTLSVLGKNFIDPEHRAALNNGLSWALFQLVDKETDDLLMEKIRNFESIKSKTENISDPDYIEAKKELSGLASPIIGLAPDDVRTTLIAIELVSDHNHALKEENKELIPEAMSRYLIHNESFLTRARFLGFPFHYFYTAIFLLVLFVGLCWLYCVRTDRNNALLGIED